MTDREKLIELIEEWHRKIPTHYLADYLLANGVIVPPCKVGDTVYRIAHNKDKNEYRIADLWEVIQICVDGDEIEIIDDSGNFFTEEDIGKTVFLTKEEAEEKLKELGKDEHL